LTSTSNEERGGRKRKKKKWKGGERAELASLSHGPTKIKEGEKKKKKGRLHTFNFMPRW